MLVDQRVKFMQVNGAVCLYKSLHSGSFAQQPNDPSKRSNTLAHRGKYWRLQKIKYAKLDDVQYVQCPSSNTTTELPWTTEQLWVSIRSNISTWNHPPPSSSDPTGLLSEHAAFVVPSGKQPPRAPKMPKTRGPGPGRSFDHLVPICPHGFQDFPGVQVLLLWFVGGYNITGHLRNRFIGGTDSIYKAYFSSLNFREYPHKIWPKIWY